jgi:arylsulfatase A-like enzyme
MREASTVFAAVRAATAPVLLVALCFGVRDALRALRQNTFAGLPRYFWVYVAIPIVALAALGVILGACVGVLGQALALGPHTIAAAATAVVTGLFLAVEARDFFRELTTAMQRARVATAPRRGATLFAATALTAAAAIGTGGAAFGAWRLDLATAAGLAIVAALVDLALLPPLLASALRELRPALRSIPDRPRPAGPRRPSVVLISIDTLRADRLGVHGSPLGLTPRLDRLAASGLVCDTAIAPSSWTLPSVASFLTGLNPAGHGAGWPLNGFDLLARAPLRPGTWTLPHALQAAGYATHAFVANPYLALQYGLSDGFDRYENVSIESELLAAIRPTLAGRLLAPVLGDRVSGSGAVVTQRALARLRQLQSRERSPFFLWLHYIDPHAPYGCGGDKSFRGDTLLAGVAPDGDLHERFEAIARLRAGEIRLNTTEKAQLVRLYDAGVADVDHQIGAVLDRVAPGEDALIVVVSDHGEEFWDHGGVEHGHTLYDELVRVPLILAGRGVPTGRRLHELVRLVDLPSTILALLDLPVPDGLDGASFLPAGDGVVRAGRDRVARCESLLFAEEKVALRTQRYKYVRSANGKEELYDLEADPQELRDLGATVDLDWARAQLAEALPVTVSGGPAPDGVEDHAVRSALRSLGYV